MLAKQRIREALDQLNQPCEGRICSHVKSQMGGNPKPFGLNSKSGRGCAALLSKGPVGGTRRKSQNVFWPSSHVKPREIMGKIRVLLADDNERILASVRTVLGEEFEIVGSVMNGRDAIAEVRRLNPDVLVIDISMPILNGLEAVSRMHSNCQTRFVFLTVHEGQEFVNAAFAAGATGYVAKSDVTTDLIPAILEALEGRKYISNSINM